MIPFPSKIAVKSLCLASVFALSGCAVPLLVTGAAVGGYTLFQEKGPKQVVKDVALGVRIKDRLMQQNYKNLTNIGIDTFENNVLLTGVVPTKQQGDAVMTVAQGTPGVKQVYNELLVGQPLSVVRRAKDVSISTQAKTRLMFASQVNSLNYNVAVVHGNAYIIGYVRNEAERQKALQTLSTVAGIHQVTEFLTISPEAMTAQPQSYTLHNGRQGAVAQPKEVWAGDVAYPAPQPSWNQVRPAAGPSGQVNYPNAVRQVQPINTQEDWLPGAL